MKSYSESRLTRKREIKYLRQTFLFGFLTLLLIAIIFYFSLPILIKLAVFLGDIKNSYVANEAEDTLPPSQPRILPLPDATNSAQITINGFSESGTIVELFFNCADEEKTDKITADAEGSFSLANLSLCEGKNEIFAKATDKTGNTSANSEKVAITFDKTPPTLTIDQPKETKFYLPQKTVQIKGQTEADASLTINSRLVVLQPEGIFSSTYTLNPGENKILLEAFDQASNKTEKELILNLE